MQLLIQQAILTEFRPAFFIMLAIAFIFFVLSLVPRGRNSNISLVTVLAVSIIQVLIGGTLLFVENNLVETFEMTADSVTLYLFIGVLVFSIVNPILFRSRNKSNQRYRYRS